MKYIYGTNNFKSFENGNSNCYLLGNGLGGFSSTTLINSLTRNDHSLFMACTKAPNNRYNVVSKIEEDLIINGKSTPLSSQEYVCYTKNRKGFNNLISFKQEYLPQWTYFYNGVEIQKTIVMKHKENTLGIKYEIENRSNEDITLELTPIFVFDKRGKFLSSPHKYEINENLVKANNLSLYIHSNYCERQEFTPEFISDYYFSYDAVDGRDSIGSGTKLLSYKYEVAKNSKENFSIIFTLENVKPLNIDALINEEIERQKEIITKSGFNHPIAKTLVRASDAFLSERVSTNGKTILAGYPWFEDWGRDTMFGILGGCISTKRFNEGKDIFKTFIKHLRGGLMPNLFPEGGKKPMYNTVDASLLFVYALYEYYKESNDIDFIKEYGYPTILEIIKAYRKGTDFNIYMDEDGLINAGQGYDQVTWMDVRYNNILPTARHGKPVEINAYWYNALKVALFFGELLGEGKEDFEELSIKVRNSFEEKFWNEEKQCLKDVVSGNTYDNQVRCNQIWAVMMPYCPLSMEKQKLVVDKVFKELYTPYGLRTLSKFDKEFVPEYGGSHFKRDMSYHQGTVWPFPLGGYYLAYLKVNNYSKEACKKVLEDLENLEPALREGCVGQLPEIYDGLYPNESRGCFAQAWSVTELLRVFSKII